MSHHELRDSPSQSRAGDLRSAPPTRPARVPGRSSVHSSVSGRIFENISPPRQCHCGADGPRRVFLTDDSRLESLHSRGEPGKRGHLPHPAGYDRSGTAADLLQGAGSLSRHCDCSGRPEDLCCDDASRPNVDGIGRADDAPCAPGRPARIHVHRNAYARVPLSVEFRQPWCIA